MNMKTVLVTGGMGFIGSNFIRVLLSMEDVFVVNVDKLTYAADVRNIEDVEDSCPFNYIFYKTDICNEIAINKIMKKHKVDYIVNFAAETHVDRSIENPNIFVKTNILGTLVLLNAAKKFSIKKFIQISTDEVYGSIDHEYGSFTEESELHPNNPYSASKAGADLMVLAYSRTHGLSVNITRCCNNFGPRQFPEKLIPKVITKALHDEKIPIYGDGNNIREWIHVEDHCRAIIKVMNEGISQEIYNIGGNLECSNLLIATKILSYLKKPTSLIEFVEDRKGHDYRYSINCHKIRAELKWTTKVLFYNGLEDTIEWYRKLQ